MSNRQGAWTVARERSSCPPDPGSVVAVGGPVPDPPILADKAIFILHHPFRSLPLSPELDGVSTPAIAS